jgi:uncharacterized protein (TIGR03086 family)
MTTSDTTTSIPADMAFILSNYRRSLDVMEAAIRGADNQRWDEQSPCENWTARQVAGHAITFIRNVAALAGDDAQPDFHAAVDFAAVAGTDPLEAWIETRKTIEAELLRRPDRLASIRMTPLGVEMPMAQLLTFQGMDPVVHGWDISATTGTPVEIPEDLAELYIARFSPVADQIRAGGLLGPARTGATGAAGRLLDFCGRIR